MSTFQDFNHLTERRKLEHQRKVRKRLVMFGIVVAFLLILIVGIVIVIVYRSPRKMEKSPIIQLSPPSPGKQSATSSKAIKMICASTDYEKSCLSSLSKATNAYESDPQPKEVIKASISAVMDEIEKVLNNLSRLNPNDNDLKVKGAVTDCKELIEFAKDELNTSLSIVDTHSIQNLTEIDHDLETWLSAVMSYQETCIDGLPEGNLKFDMQKALNLSKELTSNSLSIISDTKALMSMMKLPGMNHRSLLQEEKSIQSNLPKDHDLPNRIPTSDRRPLKKKGRTPLTIKPNVTVAKDGSGQFTSVSAALAAMPQNYQGRYVIYVKEGVYDETVIVTRKMVNVTMYGDGSQKTIITGSKNFVDGATTFQTATFVSMGDGFIAQGMCFRNTAGAIKHQAVALRVQSDHSIFLNCRIEGYQDTLYAQTHRQFYRNCVITGTIDFIFGDAAAIFQNCIIVIRRPLKNQQNVITAQGRIDRRQNTGFVLHNCRIIPDKKLEPLRLKIKSYLGRPWKAYSRTIIMESMIEDVIQEEGWLPWDGDFALKTLFYAEYGNTGPSAIVKNRVKWPGFKVITKNDALKYTVDTFIQAGNWVKPSNIPVRLGLYGA